MIQEVLIWTAAVSTVITLLLGFLVIPFLKRMKLGQKINEVGPTWHKSKEGIPTMGGIIFMFGIIAGVCAGYFLMIYRLPELLGPMYTLENGRLFMGLIMAICFGVLGFLDDYIKVSKKRNLGLTEKQKLVLQIIIAALYLMGLYLYSDVRTDIFIPFIGYVELSFFYYIFALVLIVGAVNATNLTDGIDGLCGSVTFVFAVIMVVISGILGQLHMSVLAVATAGGCLGFLFWNFYPAKVFMGDTGSMFLGGLVVALCFGTGMPVLFFLAGFVYLCEAFSVILQVLSVKLRKGKKLFKMTPIHHSFELSGYSEVKIVFLFSGVTLIFGIVAVLSVLNV